MLSVSYLRTLSLLVSTLFFLLSLLPAKSRAQNQSKIDSVQRLLRGGGMLQQIDLRRAIAIQYVDYDNEKALLYMDSALQIATHSGDSFRIVKTARMKSAVLRRIGKRKDASEILFKVLPVAKRHGFRDEMNYIYNGLALDYLAVGNYPKAFEYSFTLLAHREEAGALADVSTSYFNIGLLYYKMGDHVRALEYYTLSYDTKVSTRYLEDLDMLKMNMALCHIYLKEYSKVRPIVSEALETCAPDCSENVKLSGIFALGLLAYFEKKHDESQKHFTELIKRARILSDFAFEAEGFYFLGIIYFEAGNLNKAKQNLERSLEIAQRISHTHLRRDNYYALLKLYKEKSDLTQSSDFLNRYVALHDSLVNEHVMNQVLQVQFDYKSKKYQEVISGKDRLLFQEASVKKVVAIVSSILFIVCLILGIVAYQRNNSVQKIEQLMISRTKELIAHQDEIRRILSQQRYSWNALVGELTAPLLSTKGLLEAASVALGHDSQQYLDHSKAIQQQISKALGKFSRHRNTDLSSQVPFELKQAVEEFCIRVREKNPRIDCINLIPSGVPNTIDVAKIGDQLFEILDIESKKGIIKGMIFFVMLKENANEVGVQLRDSTGNVVEIGHEELLAMNSQLPSTLNWTREFNALILGHV